MTGVISGAGQLTLMSGKIILANTNTHTHTGGTIITGFAGSALMTDVILDANEATPRCPSECR